MQYRLASDPTYHFPAAIQDAVTAYKSLLDMDIPASNIVIPGDSAGGNVAIALLRYISSPEGDSLPSPLAALLWSPFVGLATQRNPEIIDMHRNKRTDYIMGFTLVWSVNAYVPKSIDPSNPWFSPLQHPFSTEVPLWIMVGGSEILYDTIVGFAGRMRSGEGNKVTVYEVPNAPHDIVFVGQFFGWANETDAAAQAAAEFLRVAARRGSIDSV